VKVYLLIMGVAALVTFVATPAMRHLAFRVGAVTAVRARDVHVRPTARLGGVAIWAGIAAGIALASQIPFLEPVFSASPAAWAVIGGGLVVCVLGALDDVVDLDWMAKLAGQLAAAWIIVAGGVQLVSLPIAGLTIGSNTLSLIVSMLIVVVAINAVNFVDGLDGLAAGTIAIGGSALFVYTYVIARGVSVADYSSLATLILAALVGAVLGFLPHNVHPARIFMGDSGSMVLGLTFAAAAIVVTGQIDPDVVGQREQIPAFLPILIPVMVALIPLLDMALAVVRRLLRGDSPWSPDAHHLHHLLLRFGHSHRWAVFVLHSWTAVFSVSAVLLVFMRGRDVALVASLGIVLASLITFSPTFRGVLRSAVTRIRKRSSTLVSDASGDESKSKVSDPS